MKNTLRCCALWLTLTLTACVSFEPKILVPAITLSPEEVELKRSTSTGTVDFGLNVTPNESDSLFNIQSLPGVRVRAIAANSPAAEAGIEVGDIILQIDETRLDHPDSLQALQSLPSASNQYLFQIRRDTLVYETTVEAFPAAEIPGPRELYRADPLATRAGYQTELVRVADQGVLPAARVIELFPGSPLTTSSIQKDSLILAVNGRYLKSAQDLINRLNQEFDHGESVNFTVLQNGAVKNESVNLWDPGRRISKVSLGPLIRYESSANPNADSFTLLDLWLFSLYRYQRSESERSHTILGLINVSTDDGELTEEKN